MSRCEGCDAVTVDAWICDECAFVDAREDDSRAATVTEIGRSYRLRDGAGVAYDLMQDARSRVTGNRTWALVGTVPIPLTMEERATKNIPRFRRKNPASHYWAR